MANAKIAAIFNSALVLALALGGAQRSEGAPGEVLIDRGIAVSMRDAVVLRADIFRPKRQGQFPVLLERTPYDKSQDAPFGYRAAADGYVVVLQDVRGRYTSDGEWYPFKHESDDGYDTIEWAARLPYSNGTVGMFGASYVGATQMLAAITHPPHLAGICPVVTASNYHDGWTYQGGAFEQWFNESWTSILAQDTLARMVRAQTNAKQSVRTLPLTRYPPFNFSEGAIRTDSIASLAPYFLDWLDHRNYDTYWKRWSIEEHFNDIAVPALTTAAWYDIFQGGSLRNYEGLLAKSTESGRARQHLLIVIGGHAGDGRKVGDVDFGESAGDYQEEDVTLAWYDYLFRGARNNFAHKPVRIFVMGVNQWRDEDEWPLKRAQSVRYFLHSSGHANSLQGDGKLSLHAAPTDPPDRYVYDPANPVLTLGGPLCCDAAHLAPGPKDQRNVENRQDVLVYSTEPMTTPIEVTGPVTAELYAQSSAADTDFTAKLVDVWPDGFAQNLTEGIIRARYRNSPSTPEPMIPGRVYKFIVDLWSTSNVFGVGHRLRLEISSSNFPRFERNLNTGRTAASDTQYVSATNTILHDPSHPSALILPLVSNR